MGSENDGNKDLEKLKFLWEEYKYRHEHCWKVIFQTTTAVVILSVIPYLRTDVALGLDALIIITPGLAIGTIFFAYLVMMNELDVFYDIKILFHELQDDVYVLNSKDDRRLLKLFFGLSKRKTKRNKEKVECGSNKELEKNAEKKDESSGKGEKKTNHRSNFKLLVQFYFLILLIIASVNAYAINKSWMPHLKDVQKYEEKKLSEKNDNSNTGQRQQLKTESPTGNKK